MPSNLPSFKKSLQAAKGQALFEFLFLLFTLFTISFGLLSAFNYNIGQRWKLMVEIIAKPTDTEIKLR